MTMVNGNLYLVWSNEHAGWWAQGRFGYTTDVAKAGRYTRERAIEICRNALPGWRQGMPFPKYRCRRQMLSNWERFCERVIS
jgi:hypothetical protein